MSDAFPFLKNKDLVFLKRTGNQPEKSKFKAGLKGEDISCSLATFSAYEQGHSTHQSEQIQAERWSGVLEDPCQAWLNPLVDGLRRHSEGSGRGAGQVWAVVGHSRDLGQWHLSNSKKKIK